jgi:hypothetical protein
MVGKGFNVKKKIKQEKKELSQISFPLLKQMATTNRLRDILKNHIEYETIPSVRTAWIEYFLDIKNIKIPSKS